MERLNTLLAILVSVSTLVSVGVIVFVAWIRSTIKADLAVTDRTAIERIAALDKALIDRIQGQSASLSLLQTAIIDKIEHKLDEYVRTQEYNAYKESHAREHQTIDTELTRLRDWKHKVADPLLRKHDAMLCDPEGKSGGD